LARKGGGTAPREKENPGDLGGVSGSDMEAACRRDVRVDEGCADQGIVGGET